MGTDYENGESTATTETGDVPNLEQLMQIGIQTAKQGNKQNARVIFQQILDQDKQNERAWLWMARVAQTPRDRVRYLNTVLRINPNNATALQELERMKQRQLTSNSQALRYGMIGLGVILALVIVVVLILIIA